MRPFSEWMTLTKGYVTIPSEKITHPISLQTFLRILEGYGNHDVQMHLLDEKFVTGAKFIYKDCHYEIIRIGNEGVSFVHKSSSGGILDSFHKGFYELHCTKNSYTLVQDDKKKEGVARTFQEWTYMIFSERAVNSIKNTFPRSEMGPPYITKAKFIELLKHSSWAKQGTIDMYNFSDKFAIGSSVICRATHAVYIIRNIGHQKVYIDSRNASFKSMNITFDDLHLNFMLEEPTIESGAAIESKPTIESESFIPTTTKKTTKNESTTFISLTIIKP